MKCKSIFGHKWTHWSEIQTLVSPYEDFKSSPTLRQWGKTIFDQGNNVLWYQERHCLRCGLIERMELARDSFSEHFTIIHLEKDWEWIGKSIAP